MRFKCVICDGLGSDIMAEGHTRSWQVALGLERLTIKRLARYMARIGRHGVVLCESYDARVIGYATVYTGCQDVYMITAVVPLGTPKIKSFSSQI